MGVETIRIPRKTGETVLANGTIVRFTKIKAPRIATMLSKTGIHEGRHSVTAELSGTRVIEATVTPGKGYLGLTILSEFNAAAAAAPHAHGDEGTGMDVQMIGEAGHSVGHASAVSRSILASREAQLMVMAVASELDRKGTLSGEEIRDIIESVRYGEIIKIEFIPPAEAKDQKPRTVTKRAPVGTSDILVEADLPRAPAFA